MKKMRYTLLKLMLITALLIVVLPAQLVAAAGITVDGGGGGDYLTIQAAIDAAAPGDTITVKPGTYNEWLTVSKPLTIQGEDKITTILEAPSISSKNGIYINATNDVTITGLYITGYRSGICVRDTANASITGNILFGNNGTLATDYSGVEFVSGVINSTIAGNEISYSEYGIILRNGSDNNIIDDNLLTDNTQTGIYLNSSDENQIINNTSDANKNGAYLAYGANDNLIQNNSFSNNSVHGVRLDICDRNTVEGNTILNNLHYGVFLYDAVHDNTLAANEIGNNLKGVVINTNSDNNTISGNNIYGNTEEGILLFQNVTHTEVYRNTIEANGKGLRLFAGHFSKIYNNNFLNNTYYWQAEVQSSAAVELSLAAPIGGNYWSNHNSPDSDSDGFIDTSYSVPSVATDYLPWAVQDGWLQAPQNNPPLADAGGPYNGVEGGPAIVFNGHASSDPDGDPLEYRWDFDSDGTWDTAWFSDTATNNTHVYGDVGVYTATLKVRDAEYASTDTAEVTIANAAPFIDAITLDPEQVWCGQPVNLTGVFKDPGWLDTHGEDGLPGSATVDWGDGTALVTADVTPEFTPNPPNNKVGGTVTATHSYASGGTYTITLTVTDDDGGAASEQISVQVNCTIPVFVDIKPTSCPNALNVKSGGVLPVAILGSEDFDVSLVDLDTIELLGVSPLRTSVEDVAAPYTDGFSDPPDRMDGTTAGPDGYTDLTLKFNKAAILTAIGPVNDGDVILLKLTANLQDGTPIAGKDVVWIVKKGK